MSSKIKSGICVLARSIAAIPFTEPNFDGAALPRHQNLVPY
ncbi:MAG: hypothetical protein ACK6CP_00715 [Pseudanabaena sp.]|jgi:hypothetical protein